MTEWKGVPGRPGIEASSEGQIRWQGKTVRQHGLSYRGLYRGVSIAGTGYQVHQLVARAFHPNPDGLPCVMHMDDDPANNRPENLRWGTRADNNRDRAAKGRTRNQHMEKSHCKRGHPLAGENLRVRRHKGRVWRVCLTCKAEDTRASNARVAARTGQGVTDQ